MALGQRGEAGRLSLLLEIWAKQLTGRKVPGQLLTALRLVRGSEFLICKVRTDGKRWRWGSWCFNS